MPARSLIAVCVTLLMTACSDPGTTTAEDAPDSPATEPEAEQSAAGTIERLDPRLDDLLAIDAVIEKIADGFQFIEGPVWIDDHLLFSDIPANRVYRWSADAGASVFLDQVLAPDAGTGGTGGSNGLTLDLDGNLILCEHGNRRIARMEADGTRTTIADRFEGKRLNSPNDAVFHSSGSVFFTDPPYGLAGLDDDPGKELAWQGIYRLDPDGSVSLLADGQSRPNGIGLSPDERVLYVANSDADRVWMAYPVLDDLSLGAGSVHFDASSTSYQGAPDGFAVDVEGNLWATGPGGVLIITPDGEHLGTVMPAELPANAGFGNDGRTLYMTARTGLYRVRTNVQGIMPPTPRKEN